MQHEQALKAIVQCSLHELTVESTRLPGGLEADQVELLDCRYAAADGPRQLRCVVKHLQGWCRREAEVYEHVLARLSQPLHPKLLGVQRSGSVTWLYLEAVPHQPGWQWTDEQPIRAVLDRLALLHSSPRAQQWRDEWAYDSVLLQQALTTFEFALSKRRELPQLGDCLTAVERLLSSLPRIRRELFSCSFGATWIHGDVHSQNVLLRRSAAGVEPVLIDWARSRLGSPLEDVSSWLQSLRCWEPCARRRHDTLLRHYLDRRGFGRHALNECREAYWLAAACNVLAGALTYSIDLATADPARRHEALQMIEVGRRVLRRADYFWS